MAQDVVDEFVLNGQEVDVYFRFTCEYCGERCTFDKKNTLYEEGECAGCGKITKVLFAGFSLHIHVNPNP